ncbi:DUF4440 domain-containing protein [Candidatus Saccharibacteria bacterium]|nr:DUF4440 domain-containing protein [Calditrichia bacterium]NIV99050.1 DUF4440 domain-containing protein [Candidatus Saccharibacteria bacterium]NIW79147.1 DUF4440 domain-containing protein [Calditrichia bacterium]
MKYHRLFYAVIFAMVMIACLPSASQAQQWSADQKAVWTDVNEYWDLFAKGDADGMLSYFHDDYEGWSFSDPLPDNKANTEKGLKHFLKNNSIVMHTIKPVGINVQGNFAIVHYYYDMTIKNPEGKENNSGGRWTDVLIKEGDKWMLIGDAGGGNNDDDD